MGRERILLHWEPSTLTRGSPEPAQPLSGSWPAPPVFLVFYHEAAVAREHITGLAE